MNDLDDETIKGALGEEILDQLKLVTENMATASELNRRFDDVDDRLRQLELDVRIIRAAVTDQGGELRQLDHRLGDLEQAA
jgi:predicted nuclease with TOPRIM domain